ncbi:CHAD domain-containing protein [Teredinibacter haidensis]|uniref:CHAD domain-containing protein n=1 Tax=Teredinibacter haidensis TaxID=2731755 RepID=UPI0009491AD7|nr:CHAD domain-containing protein [Teredinibacter haidensis]
MTNLTAVHYKLGSADQISALEVLFSSIYTATFFACESRELRFLDDYDWHLWHSGALLYKTSAHSYNLALPDISIEEVIKGKAPRFYWEFPDGEMQSELQKNIKLRALTPIASLKIAEQQLSLLNRDHKTVLRAKLTLLYTPDSDTPSHGVISLQPMRGYDKAFQRASLLLQNAEYALTETSSLISLLKAQGVKPKPVVSGQFGISPTMPSEQAVREMSHTMFTRARTHEQGVLEDIDTEFLHQYRVSLRKARSLINLMKKCLPAESHRLLKTQLAQLASPTNNLRDLDVFLLNENYYRSLLPENFHTGLNNLFTHIAKERQSALRSVVRFFRTGEYERICASVHTELSSQAVEETPAASQMILSIAKKRILKTYHKVRLLGGAITESTPDPEVHQLRIECKKLRYLMEFFTELFPVKTIGKLTKTLKILQTILGDFNDYSVQKAFLAEDLTHEKNTDAIAAINGLIAVLHQKQLQERAKVCAAFVEFNHNSIATQFEELFALGE